MPRCCARWPPISSSAFDPLDADLAATWTGPAPAALRTWRDAWRTAGDTVERLEALAAALVVGDAAAEPEWTTHAAPCSAGSQPSLRPAVARCGERRDRRAAGRPRRPLRRPPARPARRRAAGPMCCRPGATSIRSIPARCRRRRPGRSGWKSAGLLVERYVQEHGEYPKRIAAVRLGHEQHAHRRRRHRPGAGADRRAADWDAALAAASPASRSCRCRLLDRPRVDVTLRISGFFRDAFPDLIDLFDSAVRAVAALDEPEHDEPARRARARRGRER